MKLEAPQKGRILTLNDFTTKEIKGFIQKYNNALKIKGYSKVYKKADMIALINKHPLVEVVGNMDSVRFNVSGAQVKGMDMLYKFKPKKVVIKKMVKKKKVVEEKPKKEKPPPKPKKEKAPKKLLKFEIAWAEGKPKNASQRALIAKMSDERRAEVLKMLGLKKPKEKAPKKEKAPPKPKKEKVPTSLKNLLTYITKKSVEQRNDGSKKMYLLFNTEEIIKKTKKVNVGDSEKGEELKKMILDNAYVDKSLINGKVVKTNLLNNDDNIYRLAFEILNGRKATQNEPTFEDLNKKEKAKKEKVPPKPKKEKALPKLNEFKKQLRDSKTIEELTNIFSSSQFNTDKNSISFKQEQQLQKIYDTKLKELKKPPKKPRTKAQIEATKKLVTSNKAKKKKEVSVSFD